jgi:excisionase family DNA binding protein
MGISQLKIPKICEQCGKPFEAKTVVTRFCSPNCANKSGKAKKRQAEEAERKQTILEQSANQIAQMQTRPFLSITEATILFGISKDTIRRLIKAGKIPAFNLGQRLTRVSRVHLEAIFTAVVLPEKLKEQPVKLQYNTNECYTINEVSEKFGVSLSTVSNTIRRYSIPKRQVGNFVYVPKEQIDKIFSNKK